MIGMSLAAMLVLSFLYFSELGLRSIVLYWIAYGVGLVVIIHLLHVPILATAYAWLVVFFALFKARTGGSDMLR